MQMKRKMTRVGIIGAGVMGQGIAAHLANAGIPSLLLDRVPTELTLDEEKKGFTLQSPQVRNRFSLYGKENLQKLKPALLYDPKQAELISIGNTADDLNQLINCDWVIEVIIEKLDAKQTLFAELESILSPGTLVTSNTSGVSINKMVEGRSEEFRRNFLGTHFFNPVRYMKLLEIIPNVDTDPALITFFQEFGAEILGKGVVVCKDTVNFIANRIGTFGLVAAVEEMKRFGLGIDDVDAVTGPVMGRPKSATFRTLDLVGLDTFVNVATNVYENVDDPIEKQIFEIPDFLQEMVSRKWLGQKTGGGFYRKEGKDILVLDPITMEYRPKTKRKFASLENAKMQKDTVSKIKALLTAGDEAALFSWNVTKRVLLYAAEHAFEIAEDIESIDQAMKWGFNWELGPFELWDVLGVVKSAERMKQEGHVLPEWVEQFLANGGTRFYQKSEGQVSMMTRSGYRSVLKNPKQIVLSVLKEQGKTILKNTGASLIDIGDEVALLEFHSPNQAIGADITQMIQKSMDEVSKNWRGLVIGNQAKNFCVGANLMLLLMEAQDENWEDIAHTVREFQMTLMRLKYMNKPVVAAPFSMALGGGSEVVYPADAVQAAAETYMGLVEVGVGLLPGGGGNKELLIRHQEHVQDKLDVDLQPFVNQAFETIAMAKVSTSAKDAKRLHHLRETDGISMNSDYLLYDAKQSVLRFDAAGYTAPKKKSVRVVGENGYAVLQAGAYSMLHSGYISQHDYKIASKVAFVLAGGRVPANSFVSEEYMLDIEREAFLSLIGEPKTQERMQYMLTKGKPLRN